MGEEPKAEGVAEQAPSEPELPTTKPLPAYPGQKQKEYKIARVGGYLRLRTDWFSNFNQGFTETAARRGVPFPRALSCEATPDTSARAACTDSIGSGNMRLRLEPVVELSEKVKVYMQVDLLDNLVLGSTPDPTLTDEPALSGGQGQVAESVVVKGAWADLHTPLGFLQFGRMPIHWGLGLVQSSGAYDPVHDTYCLDCDTGDLEDRVLLSLPSIGGTVLRGAFGMAWASSAPASADAAFGQADRSAQAFDLGDEDDVNQWMFMLGRLDSPAEWQQRVDAGGLTLNYGAFVTYRTQAWKTTGKKDGIALARQRDMTTYMPDVFFRLGYGKLSFEAEGVLNWGSFDDSDDTGAMVVAYDVLQLGAVGRLNYLMADDELNLGLEVGYAAGDPWEAENADGSPRDGSLSVRELPLVPRSHAVDDSISRFVFDPNFHVDLILFRELMGAVSNALYVKPSLSYDLTDQFRFQAQAVMSFADVPVATPGNDSVYGLELDGDLGYHNDAEGFFAGVSYGVLFPFAALRHPSNVDLFGPAGGDAETAQTFQMRLALKF
jgi:uncharacterized protein (TIGR04551 family)